MRVLLTIVFMVLLTMCMAQQSDAIHYTSLNSAIYLGQYEGSQTAADLKKSGDFGVGSEERLASELVMLDGKMYSIPASGKAVLMKPEAKIPFAAVKFFKAEKSVTIKRSLTLNELENLLDSLVGRNRFAAIKVTATFSSITFRSYREQQKPYREIGEAEEVFFDYKNMKGTLVGFHTPKSAHVLNSPKYHFHVLDQARTTGGHVTECTLEEARIEIDYSGQLVVDLPTPDKLEHIDLNQEVNKN